MTRKKNQAEQEEEKLFASLAAHVEEKPVEEFVEENFLPYAWSVVLDRALVRVEDGLKPIQRRILYTAYKLGLTDKSAKMKSQNFEGRVMELSPHGGSYSAIVNIAAPEVQAGAQPRDMRVPLIKGKGGWGGLDDAASAARYTEMNLWPAAMELIKEIPENAVDFVPNYNNETTEPVFLPARWPVAFINGVPNAMAVGYACNIPCHNPDEVMDACIALAKDESLTNKDLMKHVKGPDFNCGCDIISTKVEPDGKAVDAVKQYLETGKGTFTMVAKYTVEEDRGAYIIDFYALPFKIGPKKVREAITNKYNKGGFKELVSWDVLSDLKDPVKLEVKTKKNVNINKVLEDLFKYTPLRATFAVNNTIIENNIPVVMDLKRVLSDFLLFREECTKRKLNYRLDDKQKKMHRKEGMIAVLADIDKCIKIIRGSNDDKEAKSKLMKTFKIDEEQAEYILSLQLRKLTKSDIIELKNEVKQLKDEIAEIKKILSNKKNLRAFIVTELEDTKKIISSPRKCKIMKKERQEELEEKDVFIKLGKGTVTRTFNEDEDTFKLDADGNVGILMEDRICVRSIYEILDEKEMKLSRFSDIGRKGITAVPHEGYLILVGDHGRVRATDLSTVTYPKRSDIENILPEPIIAAFVVKEMKGTMTLKGEARDKTFSLDDVSVQNIHAQGKQMYNKKLVSEATITLE